MAAVAYIALATLVLLDLGSMELGMSMPVTASALFLLLIEVVAFGTSVIAIILMRRRTSTGERRYRSANAALLLFAEAVGVDAREHLNERAFAVIDVAGSAEDEGHRASREDCGISLICSRFYARRGPAARGASPSATCR